MRVWEGLARGEFKVGPGNYTVKQEEASKLYYENKEKRERLLNKLGIFIFELLSLTVLFVYLNKDKKK